MLCCAYPEVDVRIQPAKRGDSIKPGVKRSGTPGSQHKKICIAREAGDSDRNAENSLRPFHNPYARTLSLGSLTPKLQMSGARRSHWRGTMPDSYTNLLYHIVFSTKDRQRLITSEIEPRLYEYIGGIVRGLEGISLELNGTEVHVHLLAKLRPVCALSDVLRTLKANASGWMHEVFPTLEDFSWQRGYGAFTVSQSNVKQVGQYIAKQKEHHTRVSFRDEFIQFLKANDIKYDERYL